jgi:hypothetical protein
MVHTGTGKAGVRGELILTNRDLIFRPEVRGAKRDLDLLGETVIALETLRKVSRARGSPVLEVRPKTPGVPPVVLFYFAKPPDMYSSAMPDPRGASISYLASSGVLYREEIDAWVEAIDAARAEAG